MLYLFIYQLLDSYTKSLKCDACARIAGIWQIQKVLKNTPITMKSFWVQNTHAIPETSINDSFFARRWNTDINRR